MKTQTKLTRKQQAFVQHLLDNPKDSGTKAVLATYNTKSENTAAVQAHDNLSNPKILAILGNAAEAAQNRIVELMHQDKDKRLSFDASRDVLDRTFGKATQRIESTSTSVGITIDLTGMSLDNHDNNGTDVV
jgi:phage terminase small subunit